MNDKQTEWRMIFDLSSSEGRSINDDILKQYESIVYETFNDAIHLITQIEKEMMLMK